MGIRIIMIEISFTYRFVKEQEVGNVGLNDDYAITLGTVT